MHYELSRSEVEKTRKGSKESVSVVEKTRDGLSILKLPHSGVEKRCEGLSILKLSRSEVEKTREG